MTSSEIPQNASADLPFEEALSELETIVRQLETGKVKLEDAIAAYERGTQLQKACLHKLENAQLKVEQLSVSKDGTMQKEEFHVD